MCAYLARFDLLRREAESRVPTGGSFTRAFVSMLRIRNASPSLADESLAAPSAEEFRDGCGGKGDAMIIRRDVSAATDMEEKAKGALGNDVLEAWVASRKAEKNLAKEGRDGSRRRSSGKVRRQRNLEWY